MGVTDSQLIEDSDFPSGMDLLKSGRVQAYLNTGSIIGALLRAANDPSVEQAEPFVQSVKDGKPLYGICSFAVNPQDKDLLTTLNENLLAFTAVRLTDDRRL
jgi:ABC-type amino acid transport substrate-binding protein